MGTLHIKELLEATFGEFFHFHPAFCNEFEDLIIGSGCEKAIIKQLINRLSMIQKLGDRDFGLSWLEHLKAYGNLYSLHIDACSKNYRLLFTKNKQGKLFLHVFYERSGKKNTSYEQHAKMAIARRDNE